LFRRARRRRGGRAREKLGQRAEAIAVAGVAESNGSRQAHRPPEKRAPSRKRKKTDEGFKW
jgi:hypothetical protein